MSDRTEVDWRLEVARRIEQHDDSPRVAVATAAGSVGAGVADRWSDLELDCYWWEPPTDADRRGPIDRLGAELDGIWDYDRDDEEWSEDYRVDQLPVTISNFTVATVDALLAAVLDRADTDPVKHIRLAAIQRCRVLRGEALVSAWRQRAAEFPDDLVAALVAQTLSPDVLRGWSARDALVERGDTVAIHGLLAGIELAVFNAVLALNRIYRPHRIAKWQRHLASELRIAPVNWPERPADLWRQRDSDALADVETLLRETLELAHRHSSADLADFAAALDERRRPL